MNKGFLLVLLISAVELAYVFSRYQITKCRVAVAVQEVVKENTNMDAWLALAKKQGCSYKPYFKDTVDFSDVTNEYAYQKKVQLSKYSELHDCFRISGFFLNSFQLFRDDFSNSIFFGSDFSLTHNTSSSVLLIDDVPVKNVYDQPIALERSKEYNIKYRLIAIDLKKMKIDTSYIERRIRL
jgi:hypothetical protein